MKKITFLVALLLCFTLSVNAQTTQIVGEKVEPQEEQVNLAELLERYENSQTTSAVISNQFTKKEQAYLKRHFNQVNNRSAMALDYTIDQSGTFNPIDISGTGTEVPLGDDDGTGPIAMGFTFNFIGTDHTEIYISSNGYLTFDPADVTDFSDDAIPDPNMPNDIIAVVWDDLDPGNGGQPAMNVVRYSTEGTAPNRIFVVEWFNVDQFPSGNNVTTQAQLYEGSNVIEIHTTTKPDDGGPSTQGLENFDGSDGLAVPGRNNEIWDITNDFVSFTPLGGGGGGGPCDQMTVTPASGVENGRGCSANQNWTVANDFIVPMGEDAELTQIVARILVDTGATITQADVGLWDDAPGIPGTNLETQVAVVPTSQPVVGTAFGRDVLEVTIDPTPMMMPGNAGSDVTYWISLQVTTSNGGNAFWEDQSPDVIGEFLAFENNGAGWAIPESRDGVYTFVATCTPIGGPTNDDCANATNINCGQTLSGDTSNDTDTNGDGSPDEWFAVTSSVAGELITVSTCDQAAYDTILTVYDACGGTVVATNDDGPGCSGFTSELSFVADGSSTYYIAVDGFGGASGAFDLSVTCGPVNDDPCGALAIECGVPVFGNTDTANDDTAAAPDCDTPTSAPGIWYVYEDTTGLVTDILVSTCSANTDYDTKISVYTGDCTSLPLTCVAGNDDSPNCTNFQSEVEFQSDGNTTYYILVHGFGGATGNFELNMTCTPVPPPNDMIVNSIDVDEIGVPYTDPAVAMPAATVENGNPVGCDISGGKGVWYNFTSAGNGTATAEIVSPAGNSFVVFFTAPDENAIETDLEYFFQIGNQCAPGTVANINTAAGTVYYVYVVNDGGITDITIDGTLLSTNDNVIEGFSFYPNPTNGTLNLDSVEAIEDVAIYNLLGQQVLGQSVDATSAQLDTSSLSTGAYLMKVTVNGQTGTYKVIKR